MLAALIGNYSIDLGHPQKVVVIMLSVTNTCYLVIVITIELEVVCAFLDEEIDILSGHPVWGCNWRSLRGILQ